MCMWATLSLEIVRRSARSCREAALARPFWAAHLFSFPWDLVWPGPEAVQNFAQREREVGNNKRDRRSGTRWAQGRANKAQGRIYRSRSVCSVVRASCTCILRKEKREREKKNRRPRGNRPRSCVPAETVPLHSLPFRGLSGQVTLFHLTKTIRSAPGEWLRDGGSRRDQTGGAPPYHMHLPYWTDPSGLGAYLVTCACRLAPLLWPGPAQSTRQIIATRPAQPQSPPSIVNTNGKFNLYGQALHIISTHPSVSVDCPSVHSPSHTNQRLLSTNNNTTKQPSRRHRHFSLPTNLSNFQHPPSYYTHTLPAGWLRQT